MDSHPSEEYAPLLNASFQGYVNLGGHQFKNIDATRDGCELHLHRYSGAVMVKLKEARFVIAASCVQVAELDPQIPHEMEPPTEDEMMKMAADSIQHQDAQTDAILAELGHTAPNLSDSNAPKRQKRTKRSE